MRKVAVIAIICIMFFANQLLFAAKSEQKLLSYSKNQVLTDDIVHMPLGQMNITSKNEIVLYDMGEKQARYVFLGPDGKMTREIKSDPSGYGGIFTLDSGDQLYALTQTLIKDKKTGQTKENRLQLHVYDLKGVKVRTLKLGMFSYQISQPVIMDMAADSRGNVYLLLHGEKIAQYDTKGRLVKRLGPSGVKTVEISGDDHLLLVGSNSNRPFVMKLDPKSGKTLWKTELSEQPEWSFFNRHDQSLYLLTHKGISRCNAAGKITGYQMTAEYYQIGDVTGFVVDSGENIYIATKKSTNNHSREDFGLCKYTPDKTITVQKKATLSLGGINYGTERVLDIASKKFTGRYPDWAINTDACFGKNEAMESMKKLNTELMAGKGPDLLFFTSYTSYRKYIEKGYIENLDLSITNDPDFKILDYYQNIIDGCRYKDKLYVIPLACQTTGLMVYKPTLLKEGIKINETDWTWDDFLKLALSLKKDTDKDGGMDRYALPYLDRDLWLQTIYYNSFPFVDYPNKKSSFNTALFIKTITEMKSIAKEIMNPHIKERELWSNKFDLNVPFQQEQIVFSYISLPFNWPGLDENLDFLMPPSDGKNQGLDFTSFALIAINKNSKNKQMAWNFLKVLLSREIQSSDLLSGFSLHRSGQRDKEDRKIKATVNSPGKMTMEQNIAVGRKFIENATILRYTETEIYSIFRDEMIKFLNDEKTAEETAKNIHNKVHIYLNE